MSVATTTTLKLRPTVHDYVTSHQHAPLPKLHQRRRQHWKRTTTPKSTKLRSRTAELRQEPAPQQIKIATINVGGRENSDHPGLWCKAKTSSSPRKSTRMRKRRSTQLSSPPSINIPSCETYLRPTAWSPEDDECVAVVEPMLRWEGRSSLSEDMASGVTMAGRTSPPPPPLPPPPPTSQTTTTATTAIRNETTTEKNQKQTTSSSKSVKTIILTYSGKEPTSNEAAALVSRPSPRLRRQRPSSATATRSPRSRATTMQKRPASASRKRTTRIANDDGGELNMSSLLLDEEEEVVVTSGAPEIYRAESFEEVQRRLRALVSFCHDNHRAVKKIKKIVRTKKRKKECTTTLQKRSAVATTATYSMKKRNRPFLVVGGAHPPTVTDVRQYCATVSSPRIQTDALHYEHLTTVTTNDPMTCGIDPCDTTIMLLEKKKKLKYNECRTLSSPRIVSMMVASHCQAKLARTATRPTTTARRPRSAAAARTFRSHGNHKRAAAKRSNFVKLKM